MTKVFSIRAPNLCQTLEKSRDSNFYADCSDGRLAGALFSKLTGSEYDPHCEASGEREFAKQAESGPGLIRSR